MPGILLAGAALLLSTLPAAHAESTYSFGSIDEWPALDSDYCGIHPLTESFALAGSGISVPRYSDRGMLRMCLTENLGLDLIDIGENIPPELLESVQIVAKELAEETGLSTDIVSEEELVDLFLGGWAMPDQTPSAATPGFYLTEGGLRLVIKADETTVYATFHAINNPVNGPWEGSIVQAFSTPIGGGTITTETLEHLEDEVGEALEESGQDIERKRITAGNYINNSGSTSIPVITSDDGSDQLLASGRGCNSQGAGYAGLNWAFCAILRELSDGIETGERFIYGQLKIDRDQYEGEDCGTSDATGACNYKKAWTNVRNLMTLAIVGTAILMVLATALDFGWFSNYTVKKYLARLIAGVILLIMSWAVGDFIISFANQVGAFTGSLITAPFTAEVPDGQGGTMISKASQVDLAYIFEQSGVVGKGTIYAGGAVGGVAAAIAIMTGAISIAPIFITVLLGALFVLVGFMFIIFRQAIVIALLVFAPLGVALWFLPGSDKAWRIYYRTFLSLVFIYPIIVAVIAFGRVFIWVLLQSEGNFVENPLTALIAFFVYVGMFAAIPVLFKKFLGVINQITGSTNNPAKGVFDRLKNARKGYMDRSKEQRRRRRDREDDRHLKENEGAKRTSRAGLKSTAIQAKRSWRYGTPFVPVRQGTKEWMSDVRQAESDKRYKEDIELAKDGMAQKFGIDPNNFPTYMQGLEQIAAGVDSAVDMNTVPPGVDPSTLGRKVSLAEQEAALRMLADNKQHDIFRKLHKLRGGNARLNQVWGNLARDGTMYDKFKELAIDVAKNEIEPSKMDISGLSDKDLATQAPETVGQMELTYDRMLLEAQVPGAAGAPSYQSIEKSYHQIERLLENKLARNQMPPGTYEALERIRDKHKLEIDGRVAGAATHTRATVSSQIDLANQAVSVEHTLDAEVNRRAAIDIAATDGHEAVMRMVSTSSNPVIQNSFKAAVKDEVIKKGAIATTAPHIANLEIDDDGNLGRLEDVDWLKMGLSHQQLTRISDTSARDMKTWFDENLPKARGDNVFQRKMEGYSNRDITRAITDLRATNPASSLAGILESIKKDIDAL